VSQRPQIIVGSLRSTEHMVYQLGLSSE
jgi:hypothetical protein